MIDHDTALANIRTHLNTEIAAGGLVTLYGFPTHWIANCTFPDGKGNNSGTNRWYLVRASDGHVSQIER